MDPAPPAAATATETLRAITAGDVAEHHRLVDDHHSATQRAVTGLLLGAAVGVAAVLATTRRGH